MRSNPLDNKRGPRARALLIFAAAAAAVLLAGGWVAHAVTNAQRIENVRNVLAAQGHPGAQVEPIRGDECWRARDGYAWKTATASGTVCAGPRDQVTVRTAG